MAIGGGLAGALTGFAEGTLQQRDIDIERRRQAQQVGLQREQIALSERRVVAGEAAESRLAEAQRAATTLGRRTATRLEGELKIKQTEAEAKAKAATEIAQNRAQIDNSRNILESVAGYGDFVSLPAGSEARNQSREGIRRMIETHSNTQQEFSLITEGDADLIKITDKETGESQILTPQMIAGLAQQAKKDLKAALFDLVETGEISIDEAIFLETGQSPAQVRAGAEAVETVAENRRKVILALANAGIDPKTRGFTLTSEEQNLVDAAAVGATQRTNREARAAAAAKGKVGGISETDAITLLEGIDNAIIRHELPPRKGEAEVSLEARIRLAQGLSRILFTANRRDLVAGRVTVDEIIQDLIDQGRLPDDFTLGAEARPSRVEPERVEPESDVTRKAKELLGL